MIPYFYPKIGDQREVENGRLFRKEFHARDFLKFFLEKNKVFACFEKSNVLLSWHSAPKLNKPSKNSQITNF